MANDVAEQGLRIALISAGEFGPAWHTGPGSERRTRMAGWHSGEIGELDRMTLLDRHGCLAVVRWNEGESGRKMILFAPVITMPAPDNCYHATPFWPEIEAAGRLLSGNLAGKSTTGRPGACHFIHVSLSIQDADVWANEHLPLDFLKPVG